jgi:hypothetical protein
MCPGKYNMRKSRKRLMPAYVKRSSFSNWRQACGTPMFIGIAVLCLSGFYASGSILPAAVCFCFKQAAQYKSFVEFDK